MTADDDLRSAMMSDDHGELEFHFMRNRASIIFNARKKAIMAARWSHYHTTDES